MGKTRPKRYTFDELTALVKRINVGIAEHLDAGLEVRLHGKEVTPQELAQLLQSFADKHQSVEEAEKVASRLADERRQLKVETQERIAMFEQWAKGTFGDRVYELFGFTRPRQRQVSTTKVAIGVIRRRESMRKKREVMDALKPKTESIIVVGSDGEAIGPPNPKKK